jgi:ubiquinone/menaquinone biosynthesis C-methylase UbiE
VTLRTTEKAYTRELVDAYDHRHFGGESGQFIFERDFRALRALMPGPTGLVLDIPCGTGIYLSGLHDEGYTVIGGDASLPMLEVSGQRVANVPRTLCDINHLPFSDNSFDAVMSVRLFSHFKKPDLRPMLNELRRVIRPKGRVIFDTFRWSLRQWPLFDHLLDKSFMYPISSSEVEKLIDDSGLRIVDKRKLHLFSPLWQRRLPFWMLKKLTVLEESVVPKRWLLRTFWACTKEG